MNNKLNLKLFKLGVMLVILSLIVNFSLKQPTNNKNWNHEDLVTPQVQIGTSTVTVSQLKDFSYGEKEEDYATNFTQRQYNLNDVENIYYIVNPFWGYDAAHTYLTFQFKDGQFLPVSVEARKTVDQSYNPLLGTFKEYNIFYMIVDEKDITTLRTIVRDTPLYSFKLKLTDQEKNNLFKVVLNRTISSQAQPEFYNTLFSSCTTNIFDEMNKIMPKEEKISFDWKMIFPEDSAEIFYNQKLLDIDYQQFPTYVQLKEASNIQEKARANKNLESQEFSEAIHN